MKESDWKDWKDFSEGKIPYDKVKRKISFDYWLGGVKEGDITWNWFEQFMQNKANYTLSYDDIKFFEYGNIETFDKDKPTIQEQIKAMKRVHPFHLLQFPQLAEYLNSLEVSLYSSGEKNYFKTWTFIFKSISIKLDPELPTMERAVVVAEMLLNHDAGKLLTISPQEIQDAKKEPTARKEVYDKIKKYWK